MKQEIYSNLSAECPWRDTLYWYDTIDSTNTKIKTLALEGAPHGTVVIAAHQTAGRGRMGRSFHSPSGMGLYLSVLLRPLCPPEALMHLTCSAGVATCNGIESCTGFRPGIKWVNDLIAEEKKLGGILTQLSLDPKTGLVNFAIVGIGINCHHRPEDFPPELSSIATSLAQCLPSAPSVSQLAAALISALYEMDQRLLANHRQLMEQYQQDCVTLGKPVTVIRENAQQQGVALSVDHRGGLVVEYADGSRETVNSGEVSIRGIGGYI